jgi:hypothetical protein
MNNEPLRQSVNYYLTAIFAEAGGNYSELSNSSKERRGLT